ncbi:hypothetical protein GCM10008018_36700 [Paenibacillus marchantiophytorum]|uniref:Uncharacterized protein n=1 Tax=Paenibacillus marchantiophytorum TaxID=1619310 RepID=A0ABQ1EUQ9_9BACL|nr:hypothetical protein GCM10008018_36700 [Paenibacillus marchantiophytorum]
MFLLGGWCGGGAGDYIGLNPVDRGKRWEYARFGCILSNGAIEGRNIVHAYTDINGWEIEGALSRGRDCGVREAPWAVCQGADD